MQDKKNIEITEDNVQISLADVAPGDFPKVSEPKKKRSALLAAMEKAAKKEKIELEEKSEKGKKSIPRVNTIKTEINEDKKPSAKKTSVKKKVKEDTKDGESEVGHLTPEYIKKLFANQVDYDIEHNRVGNIQMEDDISTQWTPKFNQGDIVTSGLNDFKVLGYNMPRELRLVHVKQGTFHLMSENSVHLVDNDE